MKRKEFIRIITAAMDSVESGFEYGYTCNLISFYHKRCARNCNSSIRKDYIKVFKRYKSGRKIDICFGLNSCTDSALLKQVRLNALAMYLAQSLAFKTYKDL